MSRELTADVLILIVVDDGLVPTLSVTIERYEDGDTFINEISGEEESSDGVTYHTRLTKIKVGLCGRKFALRKEDES